ncbi:hypothetical protein CsSME_00051619 [Camellia sinensis var. sinensis]
MGTFPKGEDFKLIDDKGWSLLHKRRCHFGEITRYDCASGYPLYDITSSGLTQAVKKAVLPLLHFLVRFLAWLTPTHAHMVCFSPQFFQLGPSNFDLLKCKHILRQPNFGAIEINWDATPVSLKIEVGDANGFPVMSVNTTLLELQARNSKITVEAGEYQKYCSLELVCDLEFAAFFNIYNCVLFDMMAC